MKGRRSVAGIKNGGGGGGGGVSTDLLVCFPTRAHLTLMPKPVCSPSRPTDQSKRRPLFRANKPARNQTGSEIGSDPTSPKVTCAGQIKVRPKNRPGRAQPKNWLESSVGIKKDVMNFLDTLRGLRFNMHCFGSFPGPVDGSSDEEERVMSTSTHSRTIFSKWFMVMEESQGSHVDQFDKQEEEEDQKMPPKNALLLMRCRSAPAKRGEEVARKLIEEEEEEERERDEESLMLMMSYAPNFFKLSTDIAKETWLVGSTVDPLARSRSWRR